MSAPRVPSLRTRIDDYSYQVSNTADPRFWFRLERMVDRDVITDYFLGAHPNEDGGILLVECYRVLGLTPRMAISFRDIVSSIDLASDAHAVAEQRSLYAAWGRALLMQFGAARVREHFDESRGKYGLDLVGEL